MEHIDLELYIQILDGRPYGHPIFVDNFRQAFPHIDLNNLPNTFARFVRVERPKIGDYEVYESSSYEWVDGVVMDVHKVRQMTEEERLERKTELEAGFILAKSDRIKICNKMLSNEMDATAKKLWEDCLVAHEQLTLENSDPATIKFPQFPHKDEDGNWVNL